MGRLDWLNILDILLVASVIYIALMMVRGTQAVQLLRGVILLALVVALIASLSGLTAFNWLVKSSSQALLVLVVIVLQPELRRALDRLGRAGGWSLWPTRDVETDRVIQAVATTCKRMSEGRHGALIVFERETGLQDHIETGVELDSRVNADLLLTIFFPNTALHDGAVIIRNDRIVAAACVLPLAATIPSDAHLGTRHRASVGITEQTDAVAVVVSEETGIISLAHNGRIIRHLDERRLIALLQRFINPDKKDRRALRRDRDVSESASTRRA